MSSQSIGGRRRLGGGLFAPGFALAVAPTAATVAVARRQDGSDSDRDTLRLTHLLRIGVGESAFVAEDGVGVFAPPFRTGREAPDAARSGRGAVYYAEVVPAVLP